MRREARVLAALTARPDGPTRACEVPAEGMATGV